MGLHCELDHGKLSFLIYMLQKKMKYILWCFKFAMLWIMDLKKKKPFLFLKKLLTQRMPTAFSSHRRLSDCKQSWDLPGLHKTQDAGWAAPPGTCGPTHSSTLRHQDPKTAPRLYHPAWIPTKATRAKWRTSRGAEGHSGLPTASMSPCVCFPET